jgi:hypothetical protein
MHTTGTTRSVIPFSFQYESRREAAGSAVTTKAKQQHIGLKWKLNQAAGSCALCMVTSLARKHNRRHRAFARRSPSLTMASMAALPDPRAASRQTSRANDGRHKKTAPAGAVLQAVKN